MIHQFGEYLTPKQAYDKEIIEGVSLKELEERSEDNSSCGVCGSPVWKLVATGMCFTCTTGSADASEDYELM